MFISVIIDERQFYTFSNYRLRYVSTLLQQINTDSFVGYKLNV